MFCRSDRRATKRPFVFYVEKGRAATPASFSQNKSHPEQKENATLGVRELRLGGGLEIRVKLIGWGIAPGFYIWDVNYILN
jgi:hypothetical protein